MCDLSYCLFYFFYTVCFRFHLAMLGDVLSRYLFIFYVFIYTYIYFVFLLFIPRNSATIQPFILHFIIAYVLISLLSLFFTVLQSLFIRSAG